MICLSLANCGLSECLKAARSVDLAEVRLDLLELSIPQISELFARAPNLIATFRDNGASREIREKALCAAIRAGAKFVDLELEAPQALRRAVLKAAKKSRCRVIISHHDFRRTPSRRSLLAVMARCFRAGADAAKIACQVRRAEDNLTLLSLLLEKKPLVVVGMGEKGVLTRVAAPMLGGLFTYAAMNAKRRTAPGQLTVAETRRVMETLGARAAKRAERRRE